MEYEWYQDHKGEWRWRLRASNGEPISSGEGYRNEADCKHAIALNKTSQHAPERKLSSPPQTKPLGLLASVFADMPIQASAPGPIFGSLSPSNGQAGAEQSAIAEALLRGLKTKNEPA